ncbi:glycosyltransferase [Oxalobacter aliiformigenes]|uniref:glycosyltransferase n=1 Tax=Oxalobacter aliiformigenes TaxID=2946593 RepID=UPI0022AF27EA|nr:glycosyltransferase [Oxalobacter aliiformigenes]MCZ4064446.1 glycosyltransferase [Oxalobacter aliiformigenes]WAV99790.1 glycosyltransferase [Oxalobacter aliiformigenes]
MKIFEKTKTTNGSRIIKRYKICGVTVLKKDIDNKRRKIRLFGVPIFYNKKYKHDKRLKFVNDVKIKKYEFVPKIIEFEKCENPLVSIIIPVYNQIEYTKQCLYSILMSNEKALYEIIVADDNSSDRTKEILTFVKNIQVIRNESNLGYIKNCNNAAKYAKGKYLYFLNNDTVVQDKWLTNILSVFSNKKNAGVVGSKVLTGELCLQECGVYIFSDIFYAHYGQNANLEESNYVKECDYVSGCSLMTPKWLFDEVGGFDEIYSPAYCDDPDYCLSVKELGYATYVQPKSVIIHYGSVSYSGDSNELMRRNNEILKRKWKHIFDIKTNFKNYKVPYTDKKRPKIILVIDDFYPQYDKHAGGRTIYQFIKAFLKMNMNVKFCPLMAEDKEEPYYSELTQMGVEIVESTIIKKWIDNNPVEYIFLSRPQVAMQFMTKSLVNRGIKVFYYGHDLHHLRMSRESHVKGTNVQKEIDRMYRIEKTAINSCSMSFYPSIREKEYVEKNIGPRVKVVPPYIYDESQVFEHEKFEISSDLIFVGSSHGPNKDGLLWFLREIFPIVLKKIPDIKLNVVGSEIDAEVNSYKSNNVVIKGGLSDSELSSLYSKVRVSIAPLRYGAGIKGKVIDAVFHGLPVVTTSIGAEGIPPCDFISVSDNSVGFAELLIELYSSAEKWEYSRLSQKAFIAENYSMEKVVDVFLEEMDTSFIDNE